MPEENSKPQGLADVIADLSTVSAAAIEGVLAICARLALKETFDAADVRKVVEVMREVPNEGDTLANTVIGGVIDGRLAELEKIVGESISEPRPKKA
ncbi:MAG: hypothetical protein KKE77_13380 [Alphaproteobacteria bacterium]|uniref:Uncharacterized protein n=1 Tax=viral metagenome TaxID=1070528 RepID=A0A6M3XLT6_9ZZZZ|nr:hypothetical protein [Alphaproteobacteria bacterium]MBU2342219.1 hypothetical protein [Alphaproteobacteria bacterium]